MNIGVDISTTCIKLVALKDHKVTCAILLRLPQTGGDGIEATQLKVLQSMFTDNKLPRENVVINFRGSEILLRTYARPFSKRDDFEQWFVENIDTLIPGTPLDDVVYDHQLLNSNRVLISFARLAAIKKRINLFTQAGIMPAAIDSSGLALYRALQKHNWITEGKNCALCDVHTTNCDLLLVRQGIPYASGELPGVKCSKQAKATRTQTTTAEQFANQLEKTLDFYTEREQYHVNGIILVGEYYKISGLRRFLSQKFKVPVEPGKPFQQYGITFSSQRKYKQGVFTQALGLALKPLQKEHGINLMPLEMREERRQWVVNQRAAKIFRRHVPIAGIVLILAICSLIFSLRSYRKYNGLLEDMRTREKELAYILETERNYLASVAKLSNVQHEQYVWTHMLNEIGHGVPENVYFEEIGTESRMISSGAKPLKQKRVYIKGTAANHESLLTFVKHLEKAYQNIVVDKLEGEHQCDFRLSIIL